MPDERPVRRPDPALWLWYSIGGRLPERYQPWVLRDVTCRTWVLRHLARSMVQVSPGLLFLLLPGPLWIRAMAVLGGVLMALMYSLSYMEHTTEYRLHKHGYPLGTGKAVRDQAKEHSRARDAARYAAIYKNQESE